MQVCEQAVSFPVRDCLLKAILSSDLYYLAFPRDRTGHKLVVYGTFLLESTQTFLFTSSAFKTFATGFGNPAVLDKVDVLWFSMFMMSGIGEFPFFSAIWRMHSQPFIPVAFITQSFYAYRVQILAQSIYASVMIIAVRDAPF